MGNRYANLLKFVLGLCWFVPATIAYVLAFGCAMLWTAMKDGWREFK